MFCFPSRSKDTQRKRHEKEWSSSFLIDIPVITREELPIFEEHKIQDPEEEIIDDPSTIFFDPNEKSDFIYKAVPYFTQDLDFSYIQPSQADISLASNIDFVQDNGLTANMISPDYADSLDGRSCPVSPKVKRNFGSSSPFENKNTVSKTFADVEESLNYSINKFIPGLESTRNQSNIHHSQSTMESKPKYQQERLYEGTLQHQEDRFHENSFIDDYRGLQLYEDDLLSDVRLSLNNKGYMSDAESVKTYQDSGVYDDDLADSPKSLTSVARQLNFDDYDGGDNGEKYTAFKTPMSSKQSSVESLIMEEYRTQKKHMERKYSNRNDRGPEEHTPISPIKQCHTPKINNKYSHVQAKVECHRSKNQRSPSPGASLRSKSPSSSTRARSLSPGDSIKKNKRTKSPGGTYANNTISSANKAKPKPKSNEKGSRNKIFNEKLLFREKAKSRTDSHGVEMYSNLPKEFQEIARRLARQDRELKKSESDLRGRSNSRKSSRMTSRASSLSPTRDAKPRSRSKSNDRESNMEMFTFEKESSSKQLSRSSSIRSIPSTPALSRQHPLPELQSRAKSPSASPGRSPAHRISHEKEKYKTKNSKGSIKSTPSPVSKLYTFTTVNDSFATSPLGNGFLLLFTF
eukprot:TCONS_00032730-protein